MSQPPFSEMFETINSNVPYMKAIGALYMGTSLDGVSLRLPWRADLIGDPETGVIASGIVTALLDHCSGMAVWDRMNEFKPIVTLDLRIDYMRSALTKSDLIVIAKCYKLTRSVGFVRAFAYEMTPDDPVAAAQSAFIITSPALRKLPA